MQEPTEQHSTSEGATTSQPDASTSKPKAKLRWLWRLVIFLILLGLLYLFRLPILKGLSRGIIASDSVRSTTIVLNLQADNGYAIASRLYHDKEVNKILVLAPEQNRLETMGIRPDVKAIGIKELNRLGVPDGELIYCPCPGRGDWSKARGIENWLKDHPDETLLVLCDQFRSGYWRCVFARTIDESRLSRVSIKPCVHRWFHEDNWWHSKQGVLALFTNYVSCTHVICCGETEEPEEWNPDKYESSLRKLDQ